MKRTLFSVVLVSVMAVAPATQLDVLNPQGKKVGTATHTLNNAAGKITSKLVLTMVEQGANVSLTMISIYTSAGDPRSHVMNVTANAQGNSVNAKTIVSFSGRKATITTSGPGQSSTKSTTAPGPVRDVSVLWSTGKVPAVGTKSTYYGLNIMTGAFEKNTATYHGIRSVKIGAKTLSAHVVTESQGTEQVKIYFTSKGELLRLESKQFNLVQK